MAFGGWWPTWERQWWGGGSDTAAVRKECGEGDRGTVCSWLPATPPHPMSLFSPGAASGCDTELSEGRCRCARPVAGMGLGWVAGGWWQ